jgi:hypothetical protein
MQSYLRPTDAEAPSGHTQAGLRPGSFFRNVKVLSGATVREMGLRSDTRFFRTNTTALSLYIGGRDSTSCLCQPGVSGLWSGWAGQPPPPSTRDGRQQAGRFDALGALGVLGVQFADDESERAPRGVNEETRQAGGMTSEQRSRPTRTTDARRAARTPAIYSRPISPPGALGPETPAAGCTIHDDGCCT